jgi:hypothetical protein
MSTSEKLVHELDPTGLDLDKVTTCASLSTGTSPPIKEYCAFFRGYTPNPYRRRANVFTRTDTKMRTSKPATPPTHALAYTRGIKSPAPLLASFHKANSSLILITSCCTLHCCLTLLNTLALRCFQSIQACEDSIIH